LFSLQGKTALLTGASGGIGRALAVALAEAGAVVALNGTARERLEATIHAVAAVGGRCVMFPTALNDVDSCRRLIEDVSKSFDRIDILINCAGMNRRKPILDVTEEDYDTIQAVNLRSVFFLCQAIHPVMKEGGGGAILNIGSMTSHRGIGEVSVYGATKSALVQLTKTMAVEWAKDGIRVNSLSPGFMMTPLTAAGLWGDENKRRWILDRVAMRRPGLPDELIGAALLLVSHASSFITGEDIAVDGGFLAGGSWLPDE
jgi:2-deoxy-D-gluconate 3-dehydrogenase